MSSFEQPKATPHLSEVCKAGQGTACCRYVLAGADGITCGKISPTWKRIIDDRVSTMTAQGDNCPGVGGQITEFELPPTSANAELLKAERDEARKWGREMHRRAQKAEGKIARAMGWVKDAISISGKRRPPYNGNVPIGYVLDVRKELTDK